jgi:dTDP-4-amino-4,6-dideoxygalactose transaminase
MPGQKPFIPFNNCQRQYQHLQHQVLSTIDKVLSTGQLLNGHWLATLEDQIACRTGREYAIAVNSGTNAINYIFDLLQRERKIMHVPDKLDIAIPAFSFRSTRNCVISRGNIMNIDVDSYSGLLDLNNLNPQMNLDVLMYVNLFGNMLDYEKLVTIQSLFMGSKKMTVIEDAAQSFGSTYKGRPSGSFGDFSMFSFDPTKNLSSIGSGGMILTDRHDAAAWLWEYTRNGSLYGSDGKVNSTMSEVDAAVMLVKLEHFDAWQERRTAIANYYSAFLHEDIITPDQTLTEGVVPNWHKYVIVSNRRDTIAQALEDAAIETKIHYKMHADSMIVVPSTDHIGARTLSNNVLSLPIYPELTDVEVERIVEEVNRPLKNNVKMMNRMPGRLLDTD